VILDNCLFHRSIPNTSTLLRVSVDLRYKNKENFKYKISYKLRYRVYKNKCKQILKNVMKK